MSDRPLLRLAAGDVPHLPLGTMPTPVEHAVDLGAEIGVPDLYVKRDGRTGELYGGNKVRKLEFLLADATHRGCDGVWTLGGVGSNHVLATGLYARQQSLTPHAAQFPQPVTDHVEENLRALSTTDPELTLVGGKLALLGEMLRVRARIALARDPSLYYVPAGGSSPVGVLGFVNAGLELAAQVEAGDLPEPDLIVAPVGSGGTVAGLAIGCRLAGLETTVLGIRVIEKFLTNRWTVDRLRRQTVDRLGSLGVDLPSNPRGQMDIVGRYFGGSYGEPTAAGDRAESLAADHGLHLDPTYTAKAFAGLLGERDRRSLSEKTVVFWQTLNQVDLTDRREAATPARLPAGYQRYLSSE